MLPPFQIALTVKLALIDSGEPPFEPNKFPPVEAVLNVNGFFLPIIYERKDSWSTIK